MTLKELANKLEDKLNSEILAEVKSDRDRLGLYMPRNDVQVKVIFNPKGFYSLGQVDASSFLREIFCQFF